MAKSERRRQKQLAKRKVKRASRHRQLVRERSLGVRGLLAAACDAPLRDCMVADSIDEKGLGIVVISRDFRGEVAFASFLIDRYCLGVKDVHAQVLPRGDYRELIERYEEVMTFEDISPATARRLVEDALAYARELGFPPHSDYAKGREIFGDIDPDLADEVFEMGKDGKPFYIAGPNDSSFRTQAVINTLERKCGSGNYHSMFLIDSDALAGPHFAIDDNEDDEDDEWDDYDLDKD